ncbi:hypothetical protein HMPREF3190_01170 [Umbribacter vaginalis]|nr:hypothetical protein HMPREF3190_01170 [Coriobacteriales bacterium DNF00809]
MREHVYALGLSAQDVNVKKCTHLAPRVVKWENTARKVKQKIGFAGQADFDKL